MRARSRQRHRDTTSRRAMPSIVSSHISKSQRSFLRVKSHCLTGDSTKEWDHVHRSRAARHVRSSPA